MYKTLLIILDGWGIAEDKKISALDNAGDLYFHTLVDKYPNAKLITHGENVGLPEGQMGNSEVGHLNIGAGRVVYQELLRINNAIKDNSLENNQTLQETFSYCKEKSKPLHLIGLYSDGGVHSHYKHFQSLISYAEANGVKDIYLHLFTDGRDCDPKSSIGLIENLQKFLTNKKTKIASICGRYFAMDRDKRWERVKLSYDLMTKGKGEESNNISTTIYKRYENGETDEFLKPIKTIDFQPVTDGDAVICINFRTDRCREITEVLSQKAFPEYNMKPLNLHYTTMTEYSSDFENVNVIFDSNNLINTLGEVLENNEKSQARIAETEKYPHVTFFFSGGREYKFKGENRILIPSPKVATYDLQPEMSAFEIKDNLVNKLKNTPDDFIVVNFANTDMVGHTGVFEAAIEATKSVDKCLQEIIPVAQEAKYNILIIADHGNSDYMINPDGTPNTAHSKNLVPIILISENTYTLSNGRLADVAPTILDLMKIEKPKEMTGISLIKKQ